MRKLSLTLLAASTMLIAGIATAQPGPGARPGASWRGGGAMGGNVQMRGGNVRMHGGNMQTRGQVRTGGGFQAHGGNFRMRGDHNFRRHHGGGTWRFHRWGPRPGHNFRHFRLRRGGFINSFWFAPQFFIGNWQAYGFHAPGEDQRWVRYYDDAYLIDDHGRVIDTRYGVDWDRYGGDWDYQDGIPGYRGEWRDYNESDYADGVYGESEEYAEGEEGMRGHGGPGRPMMPHPGYGPPGPGGYTHVYGGHAGYGMYAYPIVIETITTTGSSGYTEEIVEEYVETRQRRRARRPRARCVCSRPAPRPVIRRPAPPRPRPGERG